MGMPLRITVDAKDYSFQIVNKEPITRDTVQIPISIENKTILLVRETDGWKAKESDSSVDIAIIQAIGKTIALRYRL